MISTTIWYEKGRAQNKFTRYRIKDKKCIYKDNTGIIKDFYEALNKNDKLNLHNMKECIYDNLMLKLDEKNNCYSIFDRKGNSIPYLEKSKYEKIKTFELLEKSVSSYVLIVYGAMDEVNDLFNFYKIVLDEFEIDKQQNKWYIIGPPIEKYIHGPWDADNEDKYEIQIHIPYMWEDNNYD